MSSDAPASPGSRASDLAGDRTRARFDLEQSASTFFTPRAWIARLVSPRLDELCQKQYSPPQEVTDDRGSRLGTPLRLGKDLWTKLTSPPVGPPSAAASSSAVKSPDVQGVRSLEASETNRRIRGVAGLKHKDEEYKQFNFFSPPTPFDMLPHTPTERPLIRDGAQTARLPRRVLDYFEVAPQSARSMTQPATGDAMVNAKRQQQRKLQSPLFTDVHQDSFDPLNARPCVAGGGSPSTTSKKVPPIAGFSALLNRSTGGGGQPSSQPPMKSCVGSTSSHQTCPTNPFVPQLGSPSRTSYFTPLGSGSQSYRVRDNRQCNAVPEKKAPAPSARSRSRISVGGTDTSSGCSSPALKPLNLPSLGNGDKVGVKLPLNLSSLGSAGGQKPPTIGPTVMLHRSGSGTSEDSYLSSDSSSSPSPAQRNTSTEDDKPRSHSMSIPPLVPPIRVPSARSASQRLTLPMLELGNLMSPTTSGQRSGDATSSPGTSPHPHMSHGSDKDSDMSSERNGLMVDESLAPSYGCQGDDYMYTKTREQQLEEFRYVCSEVFHERLYIAGATVAQSENILVKHRITHIINTASDTCGDICPERICYFNLFLKDSRDASEELESILYSAFDFIERAILKGPDSRVLIHCKEGVSRSASIAIGFLMWVYGMPTSKVLDKVRHIRNIINPNTGFIFQLLRYGKRLGVHLAGGFNDSDPDVTPNSSRERIPTSEVVYGPPHMVPFPPRCPSSPLAEDASKDSIATTQHLKPRYVSLMRKSSERKLYRVTIHHSSAAWLVPLGVALWEQYESNSVWQPCAPYLDPRFWYILRNFNKIYLWHNEESRVFGPSNLDSHPNPVGEDLAKQTMTNFLDYIRKYEFVETECEVVTTRNEKGLQEFCAALSQETGNGELQSVNRETTLSRIVRRNPQFDAEYESLCSCATRLESSYHAFLVGPTEKPF